MIEVLFGVMNTFATEIEFTLTSPVVPDGGMIPTKFAYHGVQGGRNVSLPLRWSGIPPGTKSFALSIIDPHPVAQNWVHWFAVNIPPGTLALAEGASGNSMPAGSRELNNTYGTNGYGGPEPPPGSGSHPYVITLYALNANALNLQADTGLTQFLGAIQGKVIASATTTGYFERK